MDGSNFQASGSRRMTFDDIPWVLSLAHERYQGWDPGGALVFLIQALKGPNMLLLRTHDAFLVGNHVAPPWYPKRRECHVMALCAKPGAHWQAVRLLRESIDWARTHDCVCWRFHSETMHDVGALARYLGAQADTPRYVIDL